MKFKLVLLLLTMFSLPCFGALHPVLDAADRLLVDSPALQEALRAKNEKERRQAALAFGRIQNGAGITPLQELLKDKVPSVRATAAFALGQFGWQAEFADKREGEIQAALQNLLSDKDAQVRYEAAIALGKVGLEKTPELIDGFFKDKDANVRRAAVQSLFRYRLVMRLRDADKDPGELPAAAFSNLMELSKDRDHNVRAAVAYYFARNADPRGEKVCGELAKDRFRWASLYALMGLAKMKAKKSKDVYVWALKHPEYQNRFASVNGLIASGEKIGQFNFLRSDRSFHVRAAFAQGLDPKDAEDEKLLKLMLEQDGSISVRAEAMKTLAKGKADKDLRAWLDVFVKDPEWVIREGAVSASEKLPTPEREKFLLEALKDSNVNVRAPALEALVGLKTPSGIAKLKEALASPHLAERATAVSLLKDRTESEVIEMAWQAYTASSDRKWVETRQDIVDLFAKTKSDTTTAKLREILNDPDTSVRAKARKVLVSRGVSDLPPDKPVEITVSPYRDQTLKKNPKVVFKTSRGNFTIECFADEAPIHVADFIGHVKSNFYNGLSWHRVVPNFVVQGGDPDGTGYGDAGYSMRAEINRILFDRGTLGMPRSQGFNTGGSQLFFTHVPTPHLDGQYTVFGRVTSGMEVLDRIERGDKIISVSLM